MIDLTVNLGHVLTIVAFAVSGIGFIWAIRKDLDVMSNRLGAAEVSIAKLTDVLVMLARQEERITAQSFRMNIFDDTLQEMRRELAKKS